MFTSDTNDRQLNRKLNKLSSIYHLPNILKENSTIIDSVSDLKNFQNNLLNNHSFNENEIINNSTTTIIGHGILNNGGIPLNSLSKIPSYQWGFKHEDSDHYHNNHNNHSNAAINNNENSNNTHHSISTANSHHHPQKGKNILNGLGTGDSISSLAGLLPSANSTALNSRLIRLPIRNINNENEDDENEEDEEDQNQEDNKSRKQGGEKRSLMNGLPYYDKEIVNKEIRILNLEKSKFKIAGTNNSWFSDSMNKTVDDVEYLHGVVILNQFLNNKRIIRDYQWIVYWVEKMGGKGLFKSSLKNINNNKFFKIRTLNGFKKYLNIKKQKIIEINKKKMELIDKRKKLIFLKEQKKLEISRIDQNPENFEKFNKEFEKIFLEDSNIFDEELSLLDSIEEINKFDENQLEIENSEFNDQSNSERINELLVNRFNIPQSNINDEEILVEKELPVDDPDLINIQNKLYGLQKSAQMQHESKITNGIISSKIVRMKRTPNPNALGFSNIRGKRPSFF